MVSLRITLVYVNFLFSVFVCFQFLLINCYFIFVHYNFMLVCYCITVCCSFMLISSCFLLIYCPVSLLLFSVSLLLFFVSLLLSDIRPWLFHSLLSYQSVIILCKPVVILVCGNLCLSVVMSSLLLFHVFLHFMLICCYFIVLHILLVLVGVDFGYFHNILVVFHECYSLLMMIVS